MSQCGSKHETRGPLNAPLSSISSDAGVSSSCIRAPSYKNLEKKRKEKKKEKSNELSKLSKSYDPPIKDRVRTDPYGIKESNEIMKKEKKN